jgi:hypothetical protein
MALSGSLISRLRFAIAWKLLADSSAEWPDSDEEESGDQIQGYSKFFN